jgi:copper chaperone CopZ
MKKIFPLTFLLSIMLWSCGDDHSKSADSKPTEITHKEVSGDMAKTVANLSIEGMTCSAGCGGKIQQDLRALNGVTGTELDFADGRPQNVVTVEFDPNQVKENDLVKCVNGIADGKYQVKAMEVVTYNKTTSGAASGSGAGVSEKNFGRVFQLLNLLESVMNMVQNH